MSDTHGPIWIVEEPAQPYHDGRFDGVTPIAPADVPEDEAYLHAMRELNRAHGISPDPIKIGVDHPHYKPPLDPQQPTPEQIADAARLAANDIALVFRIWPYSNLDPLGRLRMLHLLLIPPAPKWETMIEDMDAARQFVAEWQATEDEE